MSPSWFQQIYTVRRVSGGYAAREDVLIHKFDTRVKALFLLSPAAAAVCRMAKFDERNATTPARGPRQSCRVELWTQTPARSPLRIHWRRWGTHSAFMLHAVLVGVLFIAMLRSGFDKFS